MEAMTALDAASKYNKLFPEKGQRVQRHKRSYSAAGCAPQPARGWDEERGGGRLSAAHPTDAGRARKARSAAHPALPMSPPRQHRPRAWGSDRTPATRGNMMFPSGHT